MTEQLLRAALAPLAHREALWRTRNAMATYWAAVALLGLALLLVLRWLGVPSRPAAGLYAAGVLAGAFTLYRRRSRWAPDYRNLARQVEAQNPNLHALLLTAVEQQPDPHTGKLNYLQERTVTKAVEASRTQAWTESVPESRLAFSRMLNGVAFALAFIVTLLLARPQLQTGANSFARMQVSPGNTAIEKGNKLVVQARFEGPLPPGAVLVVQARGDTNQIRVDLKKQLEDPVFGGTVNDITNDLTYWVESGAQRSSEFKVSVFEYPRLERANARIEYPAYTGLSARQVPDTRRLSAVEGSQLAWVLELNKPVRSAVWLGSNQPPIAFKTVANAARAELDLSPIKSGVYELRLMDLQGRTNKVPARFIVEALPNRPPALKLLAPKADQRVSPLEEIGLQAEASDDFGLRAFGFTYTLVGKPAKDVRLGDTAKAGEKKTLAHLLALEEMQVAPDQLLTYYAWAEDLGPDGSVRRTASDLFFAEVRPFEEIYRESMSGAGKDQQQQGGGEGSDSLQLAELQKEIISATWKLRQPTAGSTLPEQYTKDLEVVRGSQEEALRQAQKLGQGRSDKAADSAAQTVQEEMKEAIRHLQNAARSREPLDSAVASEQAAYQALLKISEREFQVAQSRSSQSGQRQSRRNAQQLDQLDLRQAENRYETERQAQTAPTPEQRESLAILNRLKELAQRQQDINAQIKELQNALQAARTEEERAEAQRRLKRLREEQQEMLADLDETRQRMDRNPQASSQNTREQLEHTRAEAQQSAEAMDQSNTGQALAAGTRAERQLRDLSEEFRNQTSSRFAEEMRNLRREARKVEEQGRAVQEQLKTSGAGERKTLSDDGKTSELAQQMQDQRRAYTNLLNQVREVGENAETSQPLLSKQLQNAYREARPDEVSQALTRAETLFKNRLTGPASAQQAEAQETIAGFTRRIEEAAESVLGNEAEALKLAQRELNDLASQLETEAGEASGAKGNQQAQANPTGADQAAESQNQGAANNSDRNSEQAGAQEPGKPNGQQGQLAQADVNERQQGERSGQQQSAEQGQQQTPSQGQGQSQGQQQAQTGGQQQRQGQQQAQGQQGGGNRQGGGGQTGEDMLRQFQESLAQNGQQQGNRPLTGDGYGPFNERLGNVESLIDDPDLIRDLARVRDRAREMRAEFKRHAQPPQKQRVQTDLIAPLTEVRRRIVEELSRHESPDAVAPIDRDPVPARYADVVREYYEKLGK